MTGKTTNSGSNHIGVMGDDAELRLNPDTLRPEKSVEGVLGRSGGGVVLAMNYNLKQ